MKRSLITSIALISLLAMGSQVMADGKGVSNKGNSRAGNKSESESGLTDPNCRGVRAKLFILQCGGLGTGNKATNSTNQPADDPPTMTELLNFFFGLGAQDSNCLNVVSIPGCS